MLFGRIVSPSSKLRLVSNVQGKFLDNNELQVQHVYRAMDLLEKHKDLIQKRLFQYTTVALKERNVSRLYYDCTNFYTEKELEDCDVSNKSDEWYSEHTLRKYGASKEHRPNPIVQMGLFMDGDGMPLGFCINPGNTSEQLTMEPLENELVKYFNNTDIVVCTDAGLGSLNNRMLNNVNEENDPLADFGFKGKRHFICVQSIRGKNLNATLKAWAIDKKGWSYKIKKGNKVETIDNFDLNDITDDKRAEFYNVVFYKERTIAENNLDQRLIMTFSLKYQDYQRALRNRKVKRAEKMIDSGSYKYTPDTSPRAYVSKEHLTENGDKATKTMASINKDKIENDALYDGFYCAATNLFKEQCTVQQIIAIAQRRWEIEECFRIMKTDLKSRPFYHNKDSRIVAHFQTCFIALLLIRGIERKIARHNIDNLKYPEGKYSVPEILDAIRELSLISIAEGQAFVPDYNNSELISELLECFDLKELGKQIVMKDSLKKILKKIKTSPEMIVED
ncbi:MAG: IS1634 family transposase [Succinivibrio sp.]